MIVNLADGAVASYDPGDMCVSFGAFRIRESQGMGKLTIWEGCCSAWILSCTALVW